jgi:NAD(P)-dependent dehydrogenase (short-subunit alcohol dehydrogenase family)
MWTDSGRWLITGAGRGLGFSIATEAFNRGGRVIVAVRDKVQAAEAFGRALAVDAARLHFVQVDFDNENSVHAAIKEAERTFGGLDVLVNNAGRGFLAAIEEAQDDEIEAIFRVNVYGPLRFIRHALPLLRKSSASRIINISSLGGFAASAGWGIYNASKFALEGLSEALAIEATPFGLKVIIVEPGSFRTGFLSDGSLQRGRRFIEDYAETVGRTRDVVAFREGRQAGDPVAAAAVIVDAATCEQPPLRLALGPDAIGRIEAKLDAVRRDLEAWRDRSLGTIFT